MRRRCVRQTSIFSFDNMTIYKMLESTLNDRVKTKNLLFWGCRFHWFNLGLHTYTSAKTEQGVGPYIYDDFTNAVAIWCKGRPRGEGCVSLEINKYQQHLSSHFCLSLFQHSSIYSLGACFLYRSEGTVFPG